jgi:putative membrane protein
LAWIRTSLALISFGFGIERLGQAAIELDGKLASFSVIRTRIGGAVLVTLGIAATLAGMWEHRRMLQAIASNEYRYADRPPIARYMALALVAVGLAALAVILTGL